MKHGKREYFVVCALLLVVGLVLLLSLRPGHPWGGDFSLYIHHAVNLVEGSSYADTGYLFNPAHPVIGPPTYPPGFPVLLVPVIALCGVDLAVLKLVMILSWLMFVAMTYLCFRRELPFAFVVALLAIVGLNYFTIPGVNSIGSDMPFMALLYLAIFVIYRAYDTPRDEPPRWGLMVLAALLMYGSFATRTLGGLLLPSMLAYDMIRYRRITPWAVMVGGVFVVLVLVQSHFLHSDAGYLDLYQGVGPKVFAQNAYLYATRFAAYWHNGYCKPVTVALFAAVAALAIAGYVSSVRRQITLFEIFPVLYMAAVLAFPCYQGERYLMPIMPFFVLFAFRGLQHPLLLQWPRWRRAVLVSLTVALTGSYLSAYTTLKLEIKEGVAKPESVALFDFLRHNTAKNDVVVFVKPRVMALLANRDSLTYHTPVEDGELWEHFKHVGATHLVAVVNDAAFEDAADMQRLAWFRGFIDRNSARLRCVYENGDFHVYEVRHGEMYAVAHPAGG